MCGRSASELGARYVLDGSLRIAGNTLRINCVLIDATSGKHLWAERYDGVLEDVFDLQDRITSSIVATITPRMMTAEIARAQAKPTDNLSAYDLYLRAIAEISRKYGEFNQPSSGAARSCYCRRPTVFVRLRFRGLRSLESRDLWMGFDCRGEGTWI